jgi:hypothetical protein
MTEQLTANEKAYDLGYSDCVEGNFMISYEDWCQEGREGSHSAYKAGYEDCEQDNPECSEEE